MSRAVTFASIVLASSRTRFTDDDVTLMHDLELHEKLDAMIARSIKQLLLVKGLKTVAGLGPSVTAKEKRVAETKPPLKLAAPPPTAVGAEEVRLVAGRS